jgi:hypothetical protein
LHEIALYMEVTGLYLYRTGISQFSDSYYIATTTITAAAVGDLPIWTARWRFTSFPSAPSAALIDRMALLPGYRNQHISSSSIEYIFADIHNTAARSAVAVSHILALVPLHSWMDSKLEAKGFSLNTCEQTVQCMRADVPYCHAVLTL